MLTDDRQTKITPKHLLTKTNTNQSSETENFYSSQNNLLATQHLSTEEMVSQSFKRFKYRLHSVGIRWLAAKQQNDGNEMVSVHPLQGFQIIFNIIHIHFINDRLSPTRT